MAETVTVASKLQLGLQLQLQAPYTVTEEVFGGGVRDKTRYHKTGKTVVIAGCALDRGGPSDKHLVGGFALTPGVDKEFWDAWLEQHRDFPPVKNGEIFAYERLATVTGEAKEKASLKTGGEPLDPDNWPAEFKAKVKAGVN
jgi:hypothetical protein